MNPLRITLPWPDKGLSPNARKHRMRVAALRKRQRSECFVETRRQVGTPRLRPDAEFLVLLTFCPSDRRARDRDNLGASMKSALDGVADALGVNDRQFVQIAYRMAKDVAREACVVVEITEEAQQTS